MIRSLSSLFLFFLFWGPVSATAQDRKDTVATNSRDGSDTTNSPNTTHATYAENAVDSLNDSIDRPIADSLFSSSGQLREVSETQANRYKKSPDYAYANDPEYWRRETPQQPGFLDKILFSHTLGWVLLTGIAALVLYGIYQLAKENNFSLLIRKRDPEVTGNEESLSEVKMDFDEAISRSQAEGNYRMAIRFLYLRLIHILRNKGGISFRDSSTNAEITSALGKHPQAGNFRRLATAYEYTFYGGFQPNREMYETLRIEFENVQKILSD